MESHVILYIIYLTEGNSIEHRLGKFINDYKANFAMEKEQLRSFLKDLLYVRRVEEKVAELYPEQEMRCPVHLSIGQEATAVGVAHALQTGDLMFSNHRSHGHYLAKGGNLKKFFAELYGKVDGCARGRGGSMHLIDVSVGFMGATPVVSSSIPVAVGAAFTQSFLQYSRATVIFLGDAAVEEGVFHESANFAKLKNLPVLFFCEHNLYSVYTHISARQPPRKIIDLARAHGLDCYEADGNNIVEVYQTALTALEKIKKGRGPAFIEAPTYRWREHCGSNFDNHLGYRTEEEFQAWKEKCPIKRLQEKLLVDKIVSQEDIQAMISEIKMKIDEAVAFAKSSSFPEKEELDKFIYAE